MNAILNTELEAVELSNLIHKWFTENIEAYDAERWSHINKSALEELWTVPIPKEYTYTGTTVEDLPEGWTEAILDEV